MTRRYRWLLPLLVVLGLASCSERMPSQPQVAEPVPVPVPVPGPGPPPTGGTPTDSSLAANQARWAAAGLHSYRFRFRWECFCVPDYVRVVDIDVVQGIIVSVVDVETGERLDAEAAAQYRTIEGLFGFVRASMDYPADGINVAFDAGFGYPADARVDYVTGMADEEMGFRVFWLLPVLGG